jgi:hypothetical protein
VFLTEWSLVQQADEDADVSAERWAVLLGLSVPRGFILKGFQCPTMWSAMIMRRVVQLVSEHVITDSTARRLLLHCDPDDPEHDGILRQLQNEFMTPVNNERFLFPAKIADKMMQHWPSMCNSALVQAQEVFTQRYKTGIIAREQLPDHLPVQYEDNLFQYALSFNTTFARKHWKQMYVESATELHLHSCLYISTHIFVVTSPAKQEKVKSLSRCYVKATQNLDDIANFLDQYYLAWNVRQVIIWIEMPIPSGAAEEFRARLSGIYIRTLQDLFDRGVPCLLLPSMEDEADGTLQMAILDAVKELNTLNQSEVVELIQFHDTDYYYAAGGSRQAEDMLGARQALLDILEKEGEEEFDLASVAAQEEGDLDDVISISHEQLYETMPTIDAEELYDEMPDEEEEMEVSESSGVHLVVEERANALHGEGSTFQQGGNSRKDLHVQAKELAYEAFTFNFQVLRMIQAHDIDQEKERTACKWQIWLSMTQFLDWMAKDCKLLPTGSTISRLGISGCDADCIITQGRLLERDLSNLYGRIKGKILNGQISAGFDQDKARLKLLPGGFFNKRANLIRANFTNSKVKIDFDFTIATTAKSFHITGLFYRLGKMHPAIRPFCKLVKLWAVAHGLTGAKEGLFNSVSLNALCMYVAMQKGFIPAVLSSDLSAFMHEDLNKFKQEFTQDVVPATETLTEEVAQDVFLLMHEFIKIYSTFKFDKLAISLTAPAERVLADYNNKGAGKIFILEPFYQQNLARAITETQVQRYFITVCLETFRKMFRLENEEFVPAYTSFDYEILNLKTDGSPFMAPPSSQQIKKNGQKAYKDCFGD